MGAESDPARAQSQSIPDLAYAIFGAFDEGDYDHGDGLDAVAHHTIPLLRSALANPVKRDGDNSRRMP